MAHVKSRALKHQCFLKLLKKIAQTLKTKEELLVTYGRLTRVVVSASVMAMIKLVLP